MEREFPKNVKQIGNVCDEPKIYVEDYVDTYLNQLRERAQSEPEWTWSMWQERLNCTI